MKRGEGVTGPCVCLAQSFDDSFLDVEKVERSACFLSNDGWTCVRCLSLSRRKRASYSLLRVARTAGGRRRVATIIFGLHSRWSGWMGWMGVRRGAEAAVGVWSLSSFIVARSRRRFFPVDGRERRRRSRRSPFPLGKQGTRLEAWFETRAWLRLCNEVAVWTHMPSLSLSLHSLRHLGREKSGRGGTGEGRWWRDGVCVVAGDEF